MLLKETTLAEGNYKIVCEFLVDGVVQSTDFIIFNVDDQVAKPQLKPNNQ